MEGEGKWNTMFSIRVPTEAEAGFEENGLPSWLKACMVEILQEKM